MNLQIKTLVPPVSLYVPMIEDSIRELAFCDHGDHEATIQQWVHNAEQALLWAGHAVVAVDDFVQLGVAACRTDGEITVNYVAPAGVGMGIATALMDNLEKWIVAMGLGKAKLFSSAAARHFYFRRGYAEYGVPQHGAGRSWNHRLYKPL